MWGKNVIVDKFAYYFSLHIYCSFFFFFLTVVDDTEVIRVLYILLYFVF